MYSRLNFEKDLLVNKTFKICMLHVVKVINMVKNCIVLQKTFGLIMCSQMQKYFCGSTFRPFSLGDQVQL